MKIDEIKRLFEYTEWANGRILEAVRQLTVEQYTQPLPSSFPTIRETLAHIAGADWIWLQRWNGTSPTSHPEWVKQPDIDTLAANWKGVREEQRRFLDALDEEAIDRPLTHRNLKGETSSVRLGDILFHVVNHATYHRGQVVTMLRQMGATPPNTDLIGYVRMLNSRA
jgi:uncharacterized damage-inducible protein DinB